MGCKLSKRLSIFSDSVFTVYILSLFGRSKRCILCISLWKHHTRWQPTTQTGTLFHPVVSFCFVFFLFRIFFSTWANVLVFYVFCRFWCACCYFDCVYWRTVLYRISMIPLCIGFIANIYTSHHHHRHVICAGGTIFVYVPNWYSHIYSLILLMRNVNIKYWCLQAIFRRIFWGANDCVCACEYNATAAAVVVCCSVCYVCIKCDAL